MPFFAAVNSSLSTLPNNVVTAGSMLTACSMPRHQVVRRRYNNLGAHMHRRLFDPQLYLAPLDAAQSPKPCAKLATYPWFSCNPPLMPFASAQHQQPAWMAYAVGAVARSWRSQPVSGSTAVADAATACVALQQVVGCDAFILPSPLTADLSTDYATEIDWLNAGLAAARATDPAKPTFATIALSDGCLRYYDPWQNPLLDMIADAVSARSPNGVYIVIEQAAESSDTRLCGNTRVLASILRLVHMLSQDAGLSVMVGFVGGFGLACMAAGADRSVAGWYKSLHRVRLADKIEGGRAYPSFWSHPLGCDVSLDQDFDSVRAAGLLNLMADDTTASAGLMRAARAGQPVSSVPGWTYSQSNVKFAAAHFLESMNRESAMLSAQPLAARRGLVTNWLTTAEASAQSVRAILPTDAKTNLRHVQAWRDAFASYRTNQRV